MIDPQDISFYLIVVAMVVYLIVTGYSFFLHRRMEQDKAREEQDKIERKSNRHGGGSGIL